MKLVSFVEISAKAKAAIGRFPVTSLWAILGSFYLIFILEDTSSDITDTNFDIYLTLLLGVSWFIGAQFFIEQQKKQKLWQWAKLLLFIGLLGFWFYLPKSYNNTTSPEYLIRFFLFFVAGHLFVFIAPFLTKWDTNAYWNYLKSIAIAILRSGLFSFILYLGLVLALLAIDALFDARIKSERYGQLFIFCLGVVNTLVYLSDFPKAIFKQTAIGFNKALEVLVKYILIPLMLLYLAILYAYSFKILVAWDLPKGWVSYLVIALAVLGFVIQVIINPVQKKLPSWGINKFYPYFYLLLLPLLVLLFVGIFRRILDYGITENRYFVLCIAIWILGITCYMLLSGKKRLRLLPASLGVIAILVSFGPWGAVSVSKNSQIQQFKNLYSKTLQQQKVVTDEEYRRLKNLLDYMEDRDDVTELDAITGLSMEAFREKNHNDEVVSKKGYLNTAKILDSLGITIAGNTLEASYDNYIRFTSYNDQTIGGYDRFSAIELNEYFDNNSSVQNDIFLQMDSDFQLYFCDKAVNKAIDSLDVTSLLKGYTRFKPNFAQVSGDSLIVTKVGPALSYKILPTRVNFDSYNSDSINFNYFAFYFFYTKHE